MRNDLMESKGKLALFLKVAPYLNKIGKKTVLELSNRFNVCPIEFNRLFIKAKRRAKHGLKK